MVSSHQMRMGLFKISEKQRGSVSSFPEERRQDGPKLVDGGKRESESREYIVPLCPQEAFPPSAAKSPFETPTQIIF